MPFTDVLNPAQKQAVEHREGPLLIVDGAGTGKTTVITERIGWLIREGLAEPHEILALTFTDKAAGEMSERVDQLLTGGYLELWVSTFHAFGERILKAHGIDIGLPTEFKLLTQTEQWMFLHKHMEELALDYYRPRGNPAKFLAALITHFSRLKDEHISPEDYVKHAEALRLNRDEQQFTKKASDEDKVSEAKRIEELANAFHAYQRLLLQEGALDFGDLITYTLELFQERPNLLAQYREQFKYILVDEFQDTNWAQYELVKLLAHPRNNLTVVGDDDQSIYKFRGASIANILEFKKDFPKVSQVVLTENYRSGQNILDTAYDFIQLNNPNRLEVQLGKGKHSISKRLKAAKKGKGTISYEQAETEAEEAKRVVEQIIALKSAKPKLFWSDFAILVRANDHASAFLLALERAGVPFQAITSRGLYRKPEILDLINYLKLVDNYHESAAVWRVLSSPAFDLTPQELTVLTEEARKRSRSLFEICRLAAGSRMPEKAKKELARFVELADKHTRIAQRGSVHEVALAFLKDTNYLHALTEGGRAADSATQAKLDNINDFFRKIEEFERGSEDASVRAFMEMLERERRAGETGRRSVDAETGPDAVRVMTVHSAKGLEFPYVFLVELTEQRFPTIERKDPIAIPDALVKEAVPEGDIHAEEERRLFYVGITRAQDGVFFSSAKDYGGARVKKPSRFLAELGLAKEPKEKKRGAAAPAELPLPAAAQKNKPPAALRKPGREPRYSFTSLSKYADCPLKYKFAFVLKVPTKGSYHFSFGTSMHNTLYQFLTQLKDRESAKQADLFGDTEKKPAKTGKKGHALSVSEDELLQMYEKNFVEEWYESRAHRDEYFAKGKEALKDFYAAYATLQPNPIALEQGFTVRVADHTIRGKIDRVDAEKKATHIIDYKTGKPKKELTKEDKRQLLLYALAVKDPHVMGNDVDRVTYYYLEDGSQLSLEPTPADYEDVAEWVESVAEGVEAERFEPTPGFVCRMCEFKEICDFADRNA